MSDESLNVLLNQGLIMRASGGPFGGYRTTERGQQFLDGFRGKGVCPDHPDPAQDPPMNLKPGEKIIVKVGDIVYLVSVLLGPTIYDQVFEAADFLSSKKRIYDALVAMGIAASHALRHGVPDLEQRLTWSWDVGVTPRTNEVYLQVLAAKVNGMTDSQARAEARELIEHASAMCPLRLLESPEEGSASGGPKFSLLG